MMSTPMITNLKKLSSYEGEFVDHMLYGKLIGSLMYLVNTSLDLYLAILWWSQGEIIGW